MDEKKTVVEPIGKAKWTYTKDDFLTGTKPYEELYALKDDPFLHNQTINAMADYATSIGFKGFKAAYKAYSKSMKGESIRFGNVTEFTGQEMELETGTWEANDVRIAEGDCIACTHPIMPVERLVNVDTGVEKLKIAFRRGNESWRSIIAEKSVLASRQKILQLADMGISVNSETAPFLVKYLSEAEDRNYDKIPQTKSIGRLGYIPGEGFSPYVDGLVFDGDLAFRDLFNSVSQCGDYDKWISVAKECRQMSTTAKIVLAASFASPLLEILNVLPFYVHLWGGTGTGKTVALMLAASVWGNPALGKYVKTHDATAVGLEKTAEFLNHLPLCLDELQLTRNGKGQVSHDVYKLSQGVGKTRGTKFGGIERTPTWRNCILSTGETPMTNQNAGAGAVNRIIDIECKTGENVITDGNRISNVLKANYGWAGREFIANIYKNEEIQKKIKAKYDEIALSLSNRDTTEKQAMAAAAILIADRLISKTLFHDDPLTENDIGEFLASRASVSIGERGYQYLLDWVAQNSNKFISEDAEANLTELFGVIEFSQAFIIKSVYNSVMDNAGFSPATVLSWMKHEGKIEVRAKNLTKGKRIKGILRECVCLNLPRESDEKSEDVDLLPDY